MNFKNNPFFSVAEPEPKPTQQTNQPIQQSQPVSAPMFNPSVNYGATTAPPASTFPMPPPFTSGDSDMDAQYLNHWMDFLEKNNIQGLDYLEFANLLHKQFEKFGNSLTEEQLYDMAFMSFDAQGITKQRLVETANIYLQLCAKHKQEFDQYLLNDGAKNLKDKSDENARLEKANADAQAQIAALQNQIQTIQQSVVTNAQVIQSNTALIQGEDQKLKTKQRKFEANYKVVVDKIGGDIQKIQNYLK